MKSQDILVRPHVQRMAIVKKLQYDRITTTIERDPLAEIIAARRRSSTAESIHIGPNACAGLAFELSLLEGMNPPVPEVTVLIGRQEHRRAGGFMGLAGKKSSERKFPNLYIFAASPSMKNRCAWLAMGTARFEMKLNSSARWVVFASGRWDPGAY
ncbi:MAG TPA: hypothetical protein VEI52_11240 [Terriglobales bacterium]|nr:hypothetical protein [Terriglobales bacterium]